MDTFQNQSNNRFSNEEIAIKKILIYAISLFHFFKKYWYIIFISGFIGGALGLTYAFMARPLYTAKLTFALEDEKAGGGGLGGALGLASSLGIDLGSSNAGGAFSSNNLIELMKSRRVIEQTLLKEIKVSDKPTSLAEYYIEVKKWRSKWTNNDELKSISYYPFQDRGLFGVKKDSILERIYNGIISKNLNVYQKDKKVSIIGIEVMSEDELFSKLFCQELANEVSEFYINTKNSKARSNMMILQRQTDSVRNELKNAIAGVASANDNTFNLNPSLNILKTPSINRQVDVQANTAILTQLVTNLELAKVAFRKETPLIQIIDTPRFPLKKERVGRLKSLLQGGIIGAIVAMLYLLIRRWWRNNFN